MSQTKLGSLIETKVNIAIGFAISVLMWMYLIPIFYPAMTPHTGVGTGVGITIIFTVSSLIRNYFVRRVFNCWEEKYA